MQLYNLGLWIRDSYGHLAGEIYNSKDVLIQSSDSDRCIMSTQALLAGLYKPDKREYFVAGFPWRPVPVHSTPKPYDKVNIFRKNISPKHLHPIIPLSVY